MTTKLTDLTNLANLANLAVPSSSARLVTEADGALVLHRLEREARDLRQAFAGDPSIRFVVGLDLVIRRAAIRLRETGRALLHPAGHRRQPSPTRS